MRRRVSMEAQPTSTTEPKTPAPPATAAAGQPTTPPVVASDAKTSTETAATGTIEVTDADLTKTEVAIKRIAEERRKRMDAEARGKDADLATAAKKALETGDMFGFVKAFGKDPHEFYNGLTDAITKAKNASVDPVKAAEDVVAKKLEEFKTNEAAAREAGIQKAWEGNATSFLATSADDYPTVMRALAVGDIERSDLYKVALALHNAGKPSDPKSVLDHVSKEFAPPAKSAGAAAVTPPLAASSSAPPKASAADEDLGLDEAYAKAKAKFLTKN
jgi:hypothetical protein